MILRDLYRVNADWTKKTKLNVRYIDIENGSRKLGDICIGDIPGHYFDMTVSCFGSNFVTLESNWG